MFYTVVTFIIVHMYLSNRSLLSILIPGYSPPMDCQPELTLYTDKLCICETDYMTIDSCMLKFDGSSNYSYFSLIQFQPVPIG